MLPIPKHLREILVPEASKNSETRVDGIIRCTCGCEGFALHVFADTRKGYPQVCEYQDGYALVVKGVCVDCGKAYLIFDNSRHGWNGFVCHDGVSVPDDALKPWRCPKCGSGLLGLNVSIMSNGKQDYLDETGITDGDTEFSADDWAEAFSWIMMDLSCRGCGRKDKRWLDCETM